MVRSRSTQAVAVVLWTIVALLLATTNAWAQGSTTGTIRGTVQDSSGGVLPGATVTLTNTGTKAMQTAASDARGQYLLSGIFPGTYDMKVELSGFKSYEQKAIALSPNDNRGIDVKLEVGQQSETVTVTSQVELIQTQTGAREGLITAKQIENLSVIGRSALELMRILPGVVTEFNMGESVSFGGGGNNTQGYTVNGIRSSGNQVSLDGSSLIDIGSNSGVIVSLNNDMVQEVKVQSSNFAAEYGTGGMNISGVTKSGTSKFHGSAYDYWRDHRFAANDRSNSITLTEKPKSSYQYPGGNIGGPISFGDSYTKNRDRLFFFVAYEAQRQQVDSLSHFTRTYSDAMKNGDFSELLANRGSNLNSIPQLRIPRGFPNAGAAGAEQRHAAVHERHWQVLREPVSVAELRRSEQHFTTTSTAVWNRPTGTTSRPGSTGRSATARVPTCESPTRARPSRARAASGGRPPTSSRCRRRTSGRTKADRTPATSSRSSARR